MSRRSRLAALGLVVLGWGLRLRSLGGPELWFDEAASHFIAQRTPAGIVTYVASAPFEHPPLYYLVLHGCMQLFGGTEWSLRFPSVLLGTVLLIGLWRAGTALGGGRLGLVTLGFAAVSPFLVTYAQEARMYALLQCLGLLSTALLYRALPERRGRWWLAYGLSLATGVLTHYFYAFLLPAHALMAVVWREDGGRRRWRALAGALLAVAALGAVAAALLPGPRSAALQMLREGLWGKSPESMARLVQDWAYGGATITDRPAWAAPLSFLALALPLAGLASSSMSRKARSALAVWVALPTLLAIAVPYGGLVLRHFSYAVPALCLLAAAGLLELSRRSRLLGLLAVIAVAATAIPGLIWEGNQDKGHYREALEHITTYYRPGDVVLLANPHQWVPFTYYNRADLPYQLVGDGREISDDQVGAAERIWLLEWETWALDDMDPVRATVYSRAATAYSLELSPDVRLGLLQVLPTSPVTVQTGVIWSDSLALSRADAGAADVEPGDAVVASLCWEGEPPADSDAVVLLRLTDDRGTVWAEATQAPRLSWGSQSPDSCTRHALLIAGGTPPGSYGLELGLISLSTGAQLAATASDGAALGPWVPLGTVRVGSADYAAPAVVAGSGGRLNDALELVGSETDERALSAGATWSGMLQYRSLAAVQEAVLSARLVSSGGTWPLADFEPASGSLSLPQWLAGEVWRCHSSFRLPASLSAGHYRLQIGVAGAGNESGLAALLPWSGSGWVTVDGFAVAERTPNQVEDSPAVALDVTFGTSLRLYGMHQEVSAGELRLRLYWEALAPTDEPYKAFVHLARMGEGEPLAQDDRPPGSMDTSDWLAGEAYTSEHTLALPEDADGLVLRIGLYSERTMARLPAEGLSAQTDHLELALGQDGLILAP